MNRWTVYVTYVYVCALSQAKANQCDGNCMSCTGINGVSGCTKRRDGYWLSDSTCQPCSINCATCSNTSSCETCKPGFYSFKLKCALQCSANCSDGLCNEITGYCNQCPSNRYGYYCDFDCKLCKNEQCVLRNCTDGCKAGYWQYQHENSSECRPCTTNCSSCEDGLLCNVCNDGTFLFAITNDRTICAGCATNCELCSSLIRCSSCKPGYFGFTCEYNCSTHIPLCYSCDWNGETTVTCNQCDNGYILQDNNCVHNLQQCPLNCERCTINNVCDLCKAGWYGDLCDISCRNISNCVACQQLNDSVLCTVCVEGYTVMNGECVETSTEPASTARTDCTDIPNCTSCSKVNNFIVCSVCSEGYEVMKGKCRRITSQQTTTSSAQITTRVVCNDIKNCVTCFEANGFISCSECVEGYTTKDGSSSADICGRCALQSSSASFQASTFVIGLVTGIGISIFAIALIGGICYVMRRKYFPHGNRTTFHDRKDPFYENSPASNESERISSDRINQENSQQMDILEGRSSTVYEGMDSVPGSDETASGIHYQTSTDRDQHEYSSLGVREGEHVYKDLPAL